MRIFYRIWFRHKKYKILFFMLLPALIWYAIFYYGPLYGIQLAFKDYRILQGVWGSPWVGFDNFHNLFTSTGHFIDILKNTVIISLYQIIFGFPAPIILALILNEVRLLAFKRIVQTISYLPHFLSWVIMGGILLTILSPTTGFVNYVLGWFGLEPIYFLGDPHWFRFSLVVSAIWKEVGWGTVIYLAALAGVDASLYEAAVIDGAGRWKQTIHITLPSIMNVITIMFLLRLGGILDAGFDQILNLYNPGVYDVSDIIDTYVYRVGLSQFDFSLGTTVGLFKNAVSFLLVIGSNYLVKKLGQEGLW